MTKFYIVKSSDIKKKFPYEGKIWFPKSQNIIHEPWKDRRCRSSFRVFVIDKRGELNIKVRECNELFKLWMKVFHAATYDRNLMFQYIKIYHDTLYESIDLGEVWADKASTPRVVLHYMKGEYSAQLAADVLSIFHIN